MPKLPEVTSSHLRQLRHLALDMDGTIYKGETLFPTTLPFLRLLQKLNIGYTFLTNNPSKSLTDYRAKLRRMGIRLQPGQLYTAAQSTIEYLQARKSKMRRLFVLGTPSMARTFKTAGFKLLTDNPKVRPDAVVVGFDPTVTYARLCRAAWWITRGVPYVCTNPDAICPTDQATVLIDCGSLRALLEKATGRPPLAVLGKPDAAMLKGILRRHRLRAAQVGMVGDRLYTDIAMAQNAGACGILVLTGETTAAEAAAVRPRPNVVVKDLAELGRLLQEARSMA